jgi:transcriptional regulator with GAF, ATPase, and Fis domain
MINKKNVQLQITCSKGAQSAILANRMLLIGSSEENDLVVPELPEIAAKIEFDNYYYRIEAIGKTVLKLNGKKGSKFSLKPNDTLEIGLVHFTIGTVPIPSENKCVQNTLQDNLFKLLDAIGNEQDIHQLLNKLIETLKEITCGTDIFIFKLSKSNEPEIFVSSSKGSPEERFSDTIVQNVLQSRTGLFIPNALANPDYHQSKSIADLKLLSVLCVPIQCTGKMIGLIYVGSRNAAISFTKQDLDNLNLYSTIAGMLMNNVDIIIQQSKVIECLSGNTVKHGIIAESKSMQQILSVIESIADSDISILLEGETGTGKSKIAHLIHKLSNRSDAPFVVINCSALRGELLESELFGHRKGSFTGATDDHSGLFKAAQGGTLFLDEIGELEQPLQAKLLRTLETQTIRPIGSAKEFPIDVRIICATNRKLIEMVSNNDFRADLYYRINQFSIEIPPLRKRPEDILLLAYYFLEQYKQQYPKKDIFDFHPETKNYIQIYDWPGNIRELTNIIHRAVLISRSPLVTIERSEPAAKPALDFETATKDFQKELIRKTIARADGNKEEAAKALGMSRSTFFRYQSQLDV